MGNSNKGFASMSLEQRREIARKGGLITSQNKAWMAQIGQKGGEEAGRRKKEREKQNKDTNENT